MGIPNAVAGEKARAISRLMAINDAEARALALRRFAGTLRGDSSLKKPAAAMKAASVGQRNAARRADRLRTAFDRAKAAMDAEGADGIRFAARHREANVALKVWTRAWGAYQCAYLATISAAREVTAALTA